MTEETQPKYYAQMPTVIKLVVNRAVLDTIPETIEPNAKNAKALFDAMTEATEREDANLVWTKMAAKVGPMQVDFTAEQWAAMIAMIRQLTDTTFTVGGEGERK